MASSVNKRKCYSTEEVLQFLQGSEEDDETEEYALEDMEEYSDSDSQDSEVIDTESVGDLCEIGPEIVRMDHPEDQSRIEAPGQPSLVPASNGERIVKASDHFEDQFHVTDQAGNSEFVESHNVVDDSLLQHSARVWDSSDTDEVAAASDISDSSEEEDMRENIGNSTAEEAYSQEEEDHACDEADSEEEYDSQEEERKTLDSSR